MVVMRPHQRDRLREESALHIGGAPPVEILSIAGQRERIARPVRAVRLDNIHMTEQQDRAPSRLPGTQTHHQRGRLPIGQYPHVRRRKTGPLEFAREPLGNGPGAELAIDRGDRDGIREQLVGPVAPPVRCDGRHGKRERCEKAPAGQKFTRARA